MQVGIKYCGGCRASFDRKAEVDRIIDMMTEAGEAAQDVVFVSAVDNIHYDVLLAVCGCESLCADVSRCKTSNIIYLNESGSEAKVVKDIREYIRARSEEAE